MTEVAQSLTREQDHEIDAICREHGGALTKINRRRAIGQSSVIVDVFEPRAALADDKVEPIVPAAGGQYPPAERAAEVVARYRVLADGERLDISPGRPGIRDEGGQL